MFSPRLDIALEQTFDHLISERTRVLAQRFPGWYRGLVVETNDPLGFRRIRVKIPELHNNGVKTEDIFWCVPAPWIGGRGAGSFTNPMIDDIVYVSFEKQHPYGPIWTSSADATRRRSYSLWSVYVPSAAPISQDGNPETPPTDFLREYLPKDNRPMSTGHQDRYGHFLVMNSTGFFPKSHEVAPAPVGTDALGKRDFRASKNPPSINDPDTKYFVRGTKYGHIGLMADQGYDWDEEFRGDFDADSSFEEDRIKYFIRYLNEDRPKDWDQRRLDYRTRAGHKMELRDVGWEKSRSGEYQDAKQIADSMGRDERWLKLVTKGGHVIQGIDIGFDPENDQRYKRLNKSDRGNEPHGELELGTLAGDDSRMLRFITRHGNQLVLDDRGSDPRTAGTSAIPHGNGVLLRSRKGYQLQMVDQPELDHLMITTPKDQVLEINDKFQHIIISTSQSNQVHTELEGDATRTRPRYVLKTGITNDPESNTHHLKLDKQNDYTRLKTPSGAGIEMRDSQAPCGKWTEMRDQGNRAVWLSESDNLVLVRGSKGQKFILLDDNDDVVLIRNELGKIQIRAKDKIELKCDEGNICLEAPNGQIGMTSKSVEIKTDGTAHKIDPAGVGTQATVQGSRLAGFHPQLAPGEGGGTSAPKSGVPCAVDDKELERRKPLDFDQERGCDTQKEQKGPVPPSIVNPPPGGGTGGGNQAPGSPGGNPPLPLNDPRVQPPAPSSNIPGQTVQDPPPPILQPDPIASVNPGGVLWYGVSNLFRSEIEQNGLILNSLTNHLNTPDNVVAERIPLSRTLDFARGDQQALLSQRRYGNVQLILRIGNVDVAELLGSSEDDDNIVFYRGDLSYLGNIEIFEVGEVFVSTPPEFPDVE